MTACRWYALCDHEAIGTVPHPILGAVPICQRCADRHAYAVDRYADVWDAEVVHHQCARCADCARKAIGIAKATGSVGASYSDANCAATVSRQNAEEAK